MSSFGISKLTSFQLLLVGSVVLLLTLTHLCMANEEAEAEADGTVRERRFLNYFFGPPPLPGDATNPLVCERYCRNRCYQTGFSGFLGVPGCNHFCDCSFYLGR